MDIRQLEENLQPRVSTQADVASERGSDPDSYAGESGDSYAGETGDSYAGKTGNSYAGETGELSEEEDQRPTVSAFPIGQPAEGWDEAERRAPGYSRTQVYKQKAYYHRNKDELKRRREEKMAREAGIPVSRKAKPIYGDISLLFGTSAKVLQSPPHPATASERIGERHGVLLYDKNHYLSLIIPNRVIIEALRHVQGVKKPPPPILNYQNFAPTCTTTTPFIFDFESVDL